MHLLFTQPYVFLFRAPFRTPMHGAFEPLSRDQLTRSTDPDIPHTRVIFRPG